jgi:hypothetical protein
MNTARIKSIKKLFSHTCWLQQRVLHSVYHHTVLPRFIPTVSASLIPMDSNLSP